MLENQKYLELGIKGEETHATRTPPGNFFTWLDLHFPLWRPMIGLSLPDDKTKFTCTGFEPVTRKPINKKELK